MSDSSCVASIGEVSANIDERRRRIRMLAGDVEELNQLTRDIHQLVHEQHSDVQRIDDAIHSSKRRVIAAESELKQAANLSRWSASVGGGLIGSLVGGPLGLYIGVKIGLASAIVGGCVGSRLARRRRNADAVVDDIDNGASEKENALG
jgi:TolA-binding protein